MTTEATTEFPSHLSGFVLHHNHHYENAKAGSVDKKKKNKPRQNNQMKKWIKKLTKHGDRVTALESGFTNLEDSMDKHRNDLNSEMVTLHMICMYGIFLN